MNNKKDIQEVIENFIREERNTAFNPFISTRIMAAIEQSNAPEPKQVMPAWKSAIVAMSLVAALFTGIATGGLYQSKNETNDIVLINDHSMEHFDLYVEMDNE